VKEGRRWQEEINRGNGDIEGFEKCVSNFGLLDGVSEGHKNGANEPL